MCSGALAAVGYGALGTNPGRRALHQAGVLDAADRPIPDVAVDDFVANPPGSDLEWRVARTGATANGPAFAVVCLHGRGADKDFAFDSVGVHRFAADLGLDIVVAAIDGGTASYWHSRADHTDLDDRIEEAVNAAREVAGQAPVAVLGWSMGGYGALRVATRPGIAIDALVASSPAVWRSFDDTAPGAFDGRGDFDANTIFTEERLERLRSVPLRIDCGADDPFEGEVRALQAALPQAKGTIQPGFHDAKFWRRMLPEQLRFLQVAMNP